ncbi:MAG: AEC family transporter [Candidatus Cloacimonetes bacterium]|nr:AEC family transporter [Candidatus Cloacimonadota bacterium]
MLINKLLPILLYFLAGYLLKRSNVFRKDDGNLFLRAVVYLCLPAISFATFSRLELHITRLYPIITALLVIFGNFLFTRIYFRKVSINNHSNTVFLLSTLILNTSLILPFAQARWGDEGTATVLLFDIAHVALVFTFSYWAAMHYGNGRKGKAPISRILRLPPLWGIITGILVNIMSIPVPEFMYELSAIALKALIVLMMTALGLFFEFRLKHFRLVAGAILQRSLGGLLLGFVITWILGVEGVNRQMLLLISAAPVGFNTLVLTDLEDLDRDLAAEIVTTATLLAVIIIPLILLFI